MHSFHLKKIILISFLLFAVVSLAQAAPLLSTFDNDTEGWSTWSTVSGDVTSIGYDAANKGVTGVDKSLGGIWYFMSPDSWAGDWRQYIGGTIEWDIAMTDWDSGGNFVIGQNPDLTILGSSGNPAARLRAYSSPSLALNTWLHFSFNSIPESFILYPDISESGIGFADVLSDVSRIYIRGEYINGADAAMLDNVRVAPVPEPTTILLLGTGLFGLAGFGRKKFVKK